MTRDDVVVVPREPTREMTLAGDAEFQRTGSIPGIYAAMIAASPSASADRGGLREKVAELIVDMTGAGTLGMTNEASLVAARPIADAILALLPEPPALQQKGEDHDPLPR